MKKYFILMLSGAVTFTLLSFMEVGSPDDQPAKKEVKHIKMVTVKDGVRHEVDTVITGDDVKVFHFNGDRKFEWTGSDSASADQRIRHLRLEHRDSGSPRRMIVAPMAPGLPANPRVPFIQAIRHRQGNVIDLSDQGVISFKKKKMSGGREKITIIRKQVPEQEQEFMDIIIDREAGDLERMNAPKNLPEFRMKEKAPGEEKERKVEIEVK